MSKNEAKLTIIVPTRERADTLIHTLKTLVIQEYANLEILISDNFSQDDTAQVVKSFSDPRIKYVNTGKRLSMSDNWEYALEKATGDYVTFMGDDDAFLPGSVAKAMPIISAENTDAFVWQKVEYCWPDYIDEGMRNWFSIKKFDTSLLKIKSRSALKRVMKFRESYAALPCLYNSIVRLSKIQEIKELSSTKKFFNAISPDIYSGIVLSKIVDEYVYSKFPFSINGASRHSNGTSLVRQSGSEKNTPSEKFKSENTLVFDDKVQMAPSVVVCVMGEYLFAEKILENIPFAKIDWKLYVNAVIRSAKTSFFPDKILESARHTNEHLRLDQKVPESLPPADSESFRRGYYEEAFNFVVPGDQVKNVFDAAKLVEGMLPQCDLIVEKSPLKLFLKRLYSFLIVELKTLYRSL